MNASNHHYEIVPEKQRVVVHYDGAVTLDSLMEITRRVHEDPAYSPDFDGIGNLLNGVFEVNFQTVSLFADKLRQQPRHSTGHFVLVYDTPEKFGLGRMFQTLSEDIPHTLHFSRSLEEAHQLLDQKKSEVPSP